jgi:hypothetical protein
MQVLVLALAKFGGALIEGRDVLVQGLVRRIGDSKSTRIWDQNWFSRIGNMRPITCLSDEPLVLVSDLIDSTTASWNKTKIQQVFVSTDAEIILGLPLCTRVVDDFWAWTHEKKGAFSVRSEYRMLVETKPRNEAWLEGRPSVSDSTGERKS